MRQAFEGMSSAGSVGNPCRERSDVKAQGAMRGAVQGSRMTPVSQAWPAPLSKAPYTAVGVTFRGERRA
jgi:hypothetical protein